MPFDGPSHAKHHRASSTIGNNAPSSPSSPCKFFIAPNSYSIALSSAVIGAIALGLCCCKTRKTSARCGKAWKTSGKVEPRRTLLSRSHVNLPVICTTSTPSFLPHTNPILPSHSPIPYPRSPTQFNPKLTTVSTQLEHRVHRPQPNARAETRTTAKSDSPQFPSIHAPRKERQHEQPGNDQRR